MTMNDSFLKNEKKSVLTLSLFISPHTLCSFSPDRMLCSARNIQSTGDLLRSFIALMFRTVGSRQHVATKAFLFEGWGCKQLKTEFRRQFRFLILGAKYKT